jgi:DNA-binding transcriptional regulator YiaG
MFMKPEVFAELLTAANEALEHAKGKRDLRSATLPQLPEPMSPTEVRDVRESLQASQAVLARYLNVSTKLVQAWEASERTPSGPALVLLRIIEREPGIVDTFFAQHTNRAAKITKSGLGRRKVVARK